MTKESESTTKETKESITKETASQIAQLVKNPPAMKEAPVQFLG